MREFLVLFKHELKTMFPFVGNIRKRRFDWIGSLLSLVLILAVLTLFIFLVAKISQGYVMMKFNKILDPISRAEEFLNVLYLFIMFLMVIGCVCKIYSSIANKKNKEIYLRLPIKENVLLISKLVALLIWTIIAGIIFIVPVNIVFYLTINPPFTFLIKTIFMLIAMSIIVFGISIILLVPVIKVWEFLKDKYLLLFLLISGLLVGAFVIYSKFLSIVQLWLETGSIKFLFNNSFIATLRNILKFSYPTNCFAKIMIGSNYLMPIFNIMGLITLSVVAIWYISRKLFYLTLYKNEPMRKVKRANSKFNPHKPLTSLIKKEFIGVYRNPNYLFSYFALSIAMPVIVYCCYTLFDSLIVNAFGLKIGFSLAILVILLFSVLTNTFCATNISRDGVSFLTMKSLPIKSSKILLAKVMFCGFVSFVSILSSVILLIAVTNLQIGEGLLILFVATLFSLAQIMIATRLDLNNVKLLATKIDAEISSSKTIVKVTVLGLALSLIIGIISILIYILSQGSIMATNLSLKQHYAYIWPVLVSAIYFICGILYHSLKIDKSFNKLDK